MWEAMSSGSAAHDEVPSDDDAPEDGRIIDAEPAPAPRPKILVVGTDRQRYENLRRDLSDSYDVDLAIGPSVAIGMLQNTGRRLAVVVDMDKPPAQARQLLARLHEVSPEIVRIWVADASDAADVLDSANEIDVFRCLKRPYTNEQMRKALTSAAAQGRLRAAQSAMLRETLGGSVKVLVDVLAFISPTVFSRTARVCHYVKELTRALDLPDSWQVEIAAMLARIGCVTMPTEIIDRYFSGREVSASEAVALRSLPQVSAAMLGGIPRIESIVRIIEAAEKPFKAHGRTEVTGVLEREHRASQILRAATEFDHRLVSGSTREKAIKKMSASKEFDPIVLDALARAQAAEHHWQTKTLRAVHLAPGMVFAEDVHMRSGALFARRGEEVDYEAISRLTSAAGKNSLQEPFRVLVPAAPDDPEGDEDRFG